MGIASTNAVALYVNAEAIWGETPSAADMQQLRYTGESLAFGKQTVTSETIRGDRMRDQIALVGFESEGDLNFEFAFFDYDQFFEGALFATWVGTKAWSGTTFAITSTGITDSATGFGPAVVNSYVWISGATNPANNRRYRITAVAAGTLTLSPAPVATQAAGTAMVISTSTVGITTAASTLIATVVGSAKTLTFSGSSGFNPLTEANLVPGQFVRLDGFAQAGNNGIKRVASVTATVITFADTMVDETVTAATTLKITGRRLRNALDQKSFHIQKAFNDIGQYMSFQGCRVNTMSMEITAEEIITGTVSFQARKVERQTSSWATTTQATNISPVMTGSAHVGTVYQNGLAIQAGVRSISLEINNNLRRSVQISSLYPYAVGYGFGDITGQLEIYFEDATLYDQLINHTTTELSWSITDDQGNTYRVTLPSVQFSEGYPMAGGGNDDVMFPLSFAAIRNGTYDCMIQIDEMPSLT